MRLLSMNIHDIYPVSADMYVTDIKTGATSHGCEPEIIHEKAATAWVDGKNLLGEWLD